MLTNRRIRKAITYWLSTQEEDNTNAPFKNQFSLKPQTQKQYDSRISLYCRIKNEFPNVPLIVCPKETKLPN